MPLISPINYTPLRILRNGHLQTIYPHFFRKISPPPFERKRIKTHDQDFIDIDLLLSKSPNETIAILSHGLEGSSHSQYILGATQYLSKKDFDIAAWNMRSCSGEMNKSLSFYHAGMTCDLETVIQYVKSIKNYKKIILVGYSLGANLTAVYLGQYGNHIHSEIVAGCLISCPTDLKDSIEKLQKFYHRMYMENFLISMRKKVVLKKDLYQKFDVDINKALKARNFNQFDEAITAPLFGFSNPYHYYNEASCIRHLPNIKIPTIIINAKDDPFLALKCFPLRHAKNNPSLYLEVTKTGGHIGFLKSLDVAKPTYAEERIYDFFHDINGTIS